MTLPESIVGLGCLC